MSDLPVEVVEEIDSLRRREGSGADRVEFIREVLRWYALRIDVART
jgi:metal-responsive CopG/Arc/MetJ family transcriptional regulator